MYFDYCEWFGLVAYKRSPVVLEHCSTLGVRLFSIDGETILLLHVKSLI